MQKSNLTTASICLKELVNKALFEGKECIRYDVLIRYLGAKSYVETGAVGPLYEKLSQTRLALISKDPKAYVDPERFPRTIRSIRDNGFDPKSPIILGNNYRIIEGAHRLACCMYFDVPQVPFVMWDRAGGRATYPWFADNFTDEELKVINATKEELHERFKA